MGRVIGLDFDSTSVRGAELSGVGTASPRVERFGEVGLPPGAVHHGEVVEPNTVADALRRLWESARFSTRAVALGIGSHRVIARPLTVDDGKPEQVRLALPMHADGLLPFPSSEALIDFYPIERDPAHPGKVRGLLVAAARDAVNDNVSAVRRAKLRPEAVDLVPFALARTLLRGDHADGTVGLVEATGSTTNVLIASDGVPQFLRIIPSGLDEVATQLAALLGLEDAEAQAAVVTADLASEPYLIDALRDAAQPLVNAVGNTVDYYLGTSEAGELRHILLTGHGMHSQLLGEQLQARTRKRVLPADPLDQVRLARRVDRAAIAASSSAVAIGLAMGVAS